jgi:hypothetical protein
MALAVERTKKPGMHADDAGLYLQVTSPSAKSWIYRIAPRLQDLLEPLQLTLEPVDQLAHLAQLIQRRIVGRGAHLGRLTAHLLR